MKGKLNIIVFVQWLAAILMFLQLEPYFVWPLHTYIVYYNTVPLLLILAAHSNFLRISLYEILFVALAILAAFCAGSNFLGIVMSILLVLFFLCDKKFLIDVFVKFRIIYVFLIAVSMIVWFMLSIGISFPYRIVSPLNSLKDYNYIVFPFLVKINEFTLNYDSLSNTIRFMGLFDEPGVVGTVSLIMLFIGRFDMKRIYNVILLLSGILSFSLFFYFAAFVFLLYNIIVSKNKAFYKFFIVVVLGVLVYYSYSNPVTQELIWNRLERNTSQKIISGNNRSSDELDMYVENIRGTDAYYWGVGDSQITERFSSSASIKNALLRYGFVVLVLFFLFYFFYSLHYIKHLLMCLVFMAFLYMTLYQRPGFFKVYYLFLFNMAVFAYTEQYQQFFNSEKHNNPLVELKKNKKARK